MSVLSFTSQDLKNDVLRHCGELTDGTSDYDSSPGDGRALLFMNKAYLAIMAGSDEFELELGEPWTWALSAQPGIITLQPKQTGSATFTNASKSVTFSVAPTISLQGYFINGAGLYEWYYISAHQANSTSATLDSVFNDTTGSYSFTAILTDYQLNPGGNGILRLVNSMNLYRPQDFQGDLEFKIYHMDKKTLEKDYPKVRLEEGTPTFYTIVYHDPNTGIITVRFNKTAASQTRVEYDWINIPDQLLDAASSYPLIPFAFRDALGYAATYLLMLDKSDDRAEKYLALTQAKLKAMIAAENRQKTQIGKNRGRLIARQDSYWMSKRYVTQETT